MKEQDIFVIVFLSKEDKKQKEVTIKSENTLLELVYNGFKIEIFPFRLTQGERIKILTPEQKLKRLPISRAQVKQVIHLKLYQVLCLLYHAKEITKKLYNNIINSV